MQRKQQRRKLAAAVGSIAAAIASLAYVGCRWPIASCEDRVETIPSNAIYLNTRRIEPLEGGAFRIEARTYASCTEWCSELSGVRNVLSCQPPSGVVRYDGGPVELQFVCEVERVDCDRPVILNRIN